MEKDIARGPRGVCRGTSAGAARALQGQAPLSWPITTQAMNCDQTTLNTHPQAAAESGPGWFTPGLLLSVCIRPEDSSEALGGTGSCFGGCWWQFLVPIPGAVTSVPWPCLVQASGHLRSCVIWWASRKLNCCLCRFLIQPIKFSAQAEDDFRVKQNACHRASELPNTQARAALITPWHLCHPLHSTYHCQLRRGLHGWCPGFQW